MYTIAKIDNREDGRDYEIFTTHDREQIAQNLTKENAELICYWLNFCEPSTTESHPVKVASVCEPKTQESQHVPTTSVTVIKNEEQYQLALEKMSYLMDICIEEDSELENEFELLKLVIQDYERKTTESNGKFKQLDTLRDQCAIETMKIYLVDALQKATSSLDGYTDADMRSISVMSYALADAMIKNR